MQQLSGRSFVVGAVFASIAWGFVAYALSFESKLPDPVGIDPRYHVLQAAVTENCRIVDTKTDRTLLWTPGNPKNMVTKIEQTAEDEWSVKIKKIY